MKLRITHSVALTPSGMDADGERWIEGGENLGATLRSAYHGLGVAHRKFYKMDDMCRGAFLCAELLVRTSGLLEHYRKDRIGVILANTASSLDSDRLHQRALDHPEEGTPSPAVFVYTLPNIAIGEICIRHGITGENAFFIFDGFAAGPLKERVEDLFRTDRIDACIGGWLEKDGGRSRAMFYSVEEGASGTGSVPHTEEELRRVFKKSISLK